MWFYNSVNVDIRANYYGFTSQVNKNRKSYTDCVYTRFLKLKIKLKNKKIKTEKILETFFSVFVSK